MFPAVVVTLKLAMRVLVSGAGIAGPTFSWFLARTGARITVVEKSHALLPYGQNIDLQGRAITVIQKMGLIDQVRQWNTTEKGTQFINSRGQTIAPFPINEGRTASLTSEFEILRGDLAAILHKASKDYPNVQYRFGMTINEVISNDDDSVRVQFSNGEVQEFDLLVAADGQWSKLRKQCFRHEDVKMVDKGMYAVYYTIPRLPDDNDWWNIYFAAKSRLISLRPDPHGTTRAMFTRMPCNDAQATAWQEASRGDRKTQEELLRKDFTDAGWQARRILDALDQTPDFYFQAIQQVKMSKWSESRVICLGDTAYAPTPLTGMGTSLAIIGAYVLAGELSKLDDGEHPARALEAYESTFRPYVEQCQWIPSFVPAIAHPESAWKVWLLQTAFWLVAKIVAIPWLANKPGAENMDHRFALPEYEYLRPDDEPST